MKFCQGVREAAGIVERALDMFDPEHALAVGETRLERCVLTDRPRAADPREEGREELRLTMSGCSTATRWAASGTMESAAPGMRECDVFEHLEGRRRIILARNDEGRRGNRLDAVAQIHVADRKAASRHSRAGRADRNRSRTGATISGASVAVSGVNQRARTASTIVAMPSARTRRARSSQPSGGGI